MKLLPYEEWSAGCGRTVTLNRWITINVSLPLCRKEGDGYYWNFLGRRSKPIFKTADDAQLAGQKFAQEVLKDALAKFASPPEWLSQVLNEGDGTYKP